MKESTDISRRSFGAGAALAATICDADRRASARAAQGFSGAKIYQDFRKMLESEKAGH